MQLITQGGQYAISAIIALSKEPVGTIVSASELAKPLNCPAAYLSQVLSKLKPSGILKSQRGMKGGVYLAKEPREISILDVVSAIDGTDFFNQCFLGIKGCGQIEPCPFHEIWSIERQKIQDWMGKTTFDNISERMTKRWFDMRLKYK